MDGRISHRDDERKLYVQRTGATLAPSMAEAQRQHEPPTVPNHALIRVIGRGAYGEIWMARSELGVMRAVKIVDRRTFDSTTAFQREFDGMARFEPISREHSGFVDILHVGRDAQDEFFYYVMELADDHLAGQRIDPASYVPKTLKTELARRGRLLSDEVITLGLSLAESLSALHREGLVHRDIKPANIIFIGGRPKIADIGLVAATGQASYVGTEGYVPPEGPGAAQGDIYSLGKVLYELAMGKDRMDFPALHTQLDRLPDKEQLLRLNDVFLRACANDPAERYARAEQMHEDMARIRDGRPLQRLRKRRWPAIAAGLILVAVAASGGYQRYLSTARGGATIETDPPGAMVVIGDRMIRSPAHFQRLPLGAHTARVMLPGFEPLQQEIEVEADAVATFPKLRLTRSLGAAECVSKPPGAAFELREGTQVIRRGTLPAEVDDLPVGEYTLIGRIDGREKSAPVVVKRGERARVQLDFPFGQVKLESTPEGAEIVIDGKSAGRTPLLLTLADGSHEVRARIDRWPEQVRSVVIDPAKPAGAKFEFHPGSVKITSAPGGATVLSEGKELGRTPLLLEDLPPGPVRYELRRAGFEHLVLKGEVKPGEQTLLGEKFAQPIGPRRGQPWENSLGMKFVPIEGAAADGILFAVWPTRVGDFAAFCSATDRPKPAPDFTQDDRHPVVLVGYDDARSFCDWLTQHEAGSSKLADGQYYRPPTDVEWSLAAGLGDEGRDTPEQRDGKVRHYPWGKQWPPPAGAGNFADASLRRKGQPIISGYQDGFPQTSPVGSFPANRFGLCDMCGNVWQWVLEPYNPSLRWRVLRGGSWASEKKSELWLSYRNVVDPADKEVIYGFRCVLVVDGKE